MSDKIPRHLQIQLFTFWARLCDENTVPRASRKMALAQFAMPSYTGKTLKDKRQFIKECRKLILMLEMQIIDTHMNIPDEY